MPVCTHYLIDLFVEIGEALVTDKGLAPLTWQELDAWSRMTGIILSPGEARALIDLSRQYVHQFAVSVDPNCTAPYVDDEDTSGVVAKFKMLAEILRGAKQ